MFCYQCEQTASGAGCETSGVCGKKPDVAALQDLVVYQLKGIGWLAHQVRPAAALHAEACRYTVEALFTTVTNVNFDPERLVEVIRQGEQVRSQVVGRMRLRTRARESFPDAARYAPPAGMAEMVKDGSAHGVAC